MSRFSLIADAAARPFRGEILRPMLAAYYLLAGGLGLKATLLFAPRFIESLTPEVRLKFGLGFVGIGAVFGAVILVGVMLWRRWRFAVPAAIVLQVIQIPLWALHGGRYEFLAGFYAGVGWTSFGINGFAGWKASFQIAIESQLQWFIGFNVFPLIVIFLLIRYSAQKVVGSNRRDLT